MKTEEPRVFLQYEMSGERFAVPFPKFYIGDDAAFFDFCQDNGESVLHFERELDGEVRLNLPSGTEHGRVNAEIVTELWLWNEGNGEPGYVFDSSAGFRLPNGAVRAPDVSFVSKGRYDALSDYDRAHHAPLAPDFVIEVMSPSDRLKELQIKMEEYRDNGTLLGWLIDRKERTIYVYRPDSEPATLNNPTSADASPELPGFILPLDRVF